MLLKAGKLIDAAGRLATRTDWWTRQLGLLTVFFPDDQERLVRDTSEDAKMTAATPAGD